MNLYNLLSEKAENLSSKKYFVLFKDLFKYGLASIVSMAFDVGILYMLVEYGHLYYMYATTTAFCFALVMHFVLVRIFVFQDNESPILKQFFWYALIGLVGLILNNIIMYVLVKLHLWYLYAKLISVILVFFYNFFGRRRLFDA